MPLQHAPCEQLHCVTLGYSLQVPDIVTEIFRMMYHAVKYSPVALAIVKQVMAVFAALPLMPLLAIHNIELKPFSVR